MMEKRKILIRSSPSGNSNEGETEIARMNGTSGVYYWSASQTNGTATCAFSVGMNNGFIQGEGKAHKQSVCAVRAF